jgi:hypothetical protein
MRRHASRFVTALAVAFAVMQHPPTHADNATPPAAPPTLQVPAGNKVLREGAAIGTQDYICLPSGSGFAWTFFGPQATPLEGVAPSTGCTTATNVSMTALATYSADYFFYKAVKRISSR